MIKFENVYLKYVQEYYSLFDFSCEIDSHTFFIGDFINGTTSIMRILSKIDKDFTGNVLIDGENIKKIKDKNLSLAYIPQNPVLFKNKNIFNNLYYPLKIRKIDKKTAKNLIFSVFNELKINNLNIFSEYLNKKNNNFLTLKIKKLNLNEQRILSLIRAVLRKPKYVLLENFFEELNEDYSSVAMFLINRLKDTSTIIACEKSSCLIFENFKTIDLSIEKKEE